ncbi:MAG: MFS transporter [Christensenellales bacterium]|jgi:fucose permease
MNRKVEWPRIAALDMLMLCYSFNVAVIGQMFDSIRTAYNLLIAEASLLTSVQSIGGLAAVILCILLLDVLNKPKIITISSLIYFALFLAIGFFVPLKLLFAMFVAMGLFGGVVDTISNSVMAETVSREPEKYINLMHMLFAFGAMVSPVVAQQINAAAGMNAVFYAFGGFALIWAVYMAVAFRKNMRSGLVVRRESLRQRIKSLAGFYRLPGMAQVFVIAVLMSCWQASAMLYTSSMVAKVSGNGADGALALTVFFAGVMLSRLIYSRFASRFSAGLMLGFSNLTGAALWLAAMLVPGVVPKIVLIGLSAFMCGNNFPVNISAACGIAPSHTAAAAGTVMLGSFVATFAFVPAIGALADASDLGSALAVAAVPLVVLFPFALRLHKKVYAAKTDGI